MAMARYRCIKRCYTHNKLFKQGAEWPMAWLDAGYTPPAQWFVKAEDYEDTIRRNEPVGKITSAGMDPRPTKTLVEELKKRMGEIPATWNRAKIWGELIARENAESRSDPGPRKPGRPVKET